MVEALHRQGMIDFGFDLRFLAACSRGVFLYSRGRVTRLLDGQYFGMTLADAPGRCYVTEYVQDAKQGGIRDERSAVYECRIVGDSLHVVGRVEFKAGGEVQHPVRVHQVRWHDGHLWVANTRQNVVWKVRPDGEVVAEWTGTSRFDYDPDDVYELVKRARASADYEHYNSIEFRGPLVYVLAHNSAGDDKSGRSFLVTLDSSLREVGRRTDVGKACHNVLFIDDEIFICNSHYGMLLRDFKPVLRTDSFLRGLGRIGSILVVGGSAQEPSAEMRYKSSSVIYFVDRSGFRVLHTLRLGRVGNVNDILILDDCESCAAARLPRSEGALCSVASP